MPDKAEMGEKAQCTGVYMSILSPFPTPHGAARGFFNSLLGVVKTRELMSQIWQRVVAPLKRVSMGLRRRGVFLMIY
jgi:hypothetical protein